MKLPRILSLLIFLFLSGAFLSADSLLLLGETEPGEAAYPPGSVVIRPVRVDYRGAGDARFSVSLELPELWRPLGMVQSLSFDSPGSELLLAGFHIPSTAAAGDYFLALRLENETGQVEKLAIPLKVLPVPAIACSLVRQPDYVLSGSAYQVLFSCTNNGNVPVTVEAKGHSSLGFDIMLESSRFTLLPGEKVQLGILVLTPINLPGPSRHLLQLELQTLDSPPVKARASSILEIIPRTTGRESRYNTIKGEVKTLGVLQRGEIDQFGLEGELTGEGFLDQEETTHLFYRFRRPFAGAGTLVPDRSEYLIDLRGEHYSASFGTRHFSLSPLTETSSYGAGLSLSRSFGALEVSGFSLESIPGSAPESSFGSRVSYRFADRGIAAFNLFDTKREDRWTSASVEAHFLTDSGGRLGMEYASSTAQRSDDAFYTSFGWGTDRFSFFTRYTEAGPWYRGSLENRRDFITTCTYTPASSLRVQGSVGNRSWRLEEPIPSSMDLSRIGLFWSPLPGTGFTANILNSVETEIREGETVRNNEEIYRFGLTRKNGPFDFSLSYAHTGRLDGEEEIRSFGERLSAGVNAHSDGLGNITAALGYQFRDHDNDTVPASDLSLSWKRQLTSRAEVGLSYRSNNTARSWFDGGDTLRGVFLLSFPGQAKLSMTAEYGPDRRSGRVQDIKVSIAYSSSFLIPVSLKQNTGVLEGKIINVETGASLPDVVLRMGDAVAASDSFGQFRFHNLYPGEHRLFIDPASLPPGLMPEERMPLIVQIGEGTTQQELGIVRAAGLSGRVLLYRFDRNYQWLQQADGEASPYTDPVGVSGVLLRLEGPDGLVRRSLTGDDGSFSFPPLRPGRWTLHLPDDAVPDGYFLDKLDQVFKLQPGERSESFIRIFPRTRVLRFIDEGTIEE